jgi:hypothetical protein
VATGDTVYLDNSILRTVAECSTKAAVLHLLHRTHQEERAELRCGQAVHVALADWLAGADRDTMLAAFAGHYADWSRANVPDDHRLTHANVAAILAEWTRRYPKERLPLTVAPSMVEVGFVVPLLARRPGVPAVSFTGRLDAIGRDQLGDYWVLEHKTTGRITDYWRNRYRLDSQISGYVHAARLTTGQRVVGVMVNAIELKRLPFSDRKCKVHATLYHECAPLHAEFEMLPLTRTDEQLARWQETARRLAARFLVLREQVTGFGDIARLPMEGTFNYGCAWCSLKDYCAAGRLPAHAATMLVEDEWRPFTIPTTAPPAAPRGG